LAKLTKAISLQKGDIDIEIKKIESNQDIDCEKFDLLMESYQKMTNQLSQHQN